MTDQLHLLPKHRGILQDLLRQHLPDVEVWAYGSRINGQSHDGSDLDLVLRGPDLNEIPAGQLGEFEEAVRESNIPFLVEARDWVRLPERFHREIERDHVVLVRTEDSQVGTIWRDMVFSEAVQLNPNVQLERGKTYPYVDMAALSSNYRSAHSPTQREYSGGGARFRHGDTLMARITPCLENGRIGRFVSASDDPAHGSTEFIVIRGRHNITDTGFAYYLTEWHEVRNYAVDQMTGTSGRQRVPTDCFDYLIVPIPPLPQQRAIARILGTLDDKIEMNRRMNETLEAMGRALFKSWFVDFDPIRAKMEGRDTGLPRAFANLFPNEFADSEIGEIPKEWALTALEEVMEINPLRRLRKAEVAPYLDMANMPTNGHIPMTWTERPFGSGVRFVNGDTLLARITPCLENGKTAYVDFLEADQVGWGSTEYIVLRPKSPLPSEFGYFLARSSGFREFAIQCMTGSSGRQRVPVQALAQYRVAVPPESVAENFGRLVRPLVRRASDAVRETWALSALRDTLLPKLISGEVRVKQVERASA